MGLFEDGHLPRPVLHGHAFEPDGLGRRGADLFANNAGNVMGKRQAAAPVNHGQADFHRRFLFELQVLDGARGTNLAAQGAAVFAIADFRHKHRRPDAFKAGFQEGRLQAARNANLHAFPTFDAALEKRRLVQRSRGPDQDRIRRANLGQGSNAEQGHSGHTGHERADDPSFSQIEAGRRRIFVKAEGHGIFRARIIAVPANETFRFSPGLFHVGKGRALAIPDA